MFMDIALFASECLCKANEIIGWLGDTITLDCHMGDIMEKLRISRFKSLVEIWKLEDETIRVHDLYGMLAERNTSVHNIVPRFIFQRRGLVPPQVLLDKDRSRIVERASFVEAKFEMLKLQTCTKLLVVTARRCEKLRTLCIQRLYLVSFELAGCALESLDLSGLSNLRWLHVSSCIDLMKLDASEVERLQHVNISKCSKLRDLNFKKCTMVKSVSFSYNKKLSHVNLGSGVSLKCLTLCFCGSLTDLEINGAVYLSSLKKRGCDQLMAMEGGGIMCEDLQYMILEKWGRLSPAFVKALEISAALCVLDFWHSCISGLPDLRACSSLREVRFCDVDVFLVSNNQELIQEYRGILSYSTEDLELPSSIENVQIERCKNVVVKEIFWKVQGLRNLRLLLLRDVRLGWDWEKYRTRKGQRRTKIFALSLEKEYAKLYKSLSCEQNGGTNEDCTCINDGGMSMLKGEMKLMHQQLSMDMPPKASAAGYLDDIICWVQGFLDVFAG